MRVPGVAILPQTLEVADRERIRSVGWATARRALTFLRPYRMRGAAVVVLAVAIAAIGVVPAIMMKQIFDVALPGRSTALLLTFAALWIASQAVVAALSVAQNSLVDRVAHHVMFDVQAQLYAGLQRQSLRFFSTVRGGDVISRISADVASIQQTVRYSTVTILSALLTTLTTVALMVQLHAGIAIAALVVMPLFVLPARRVGRLQQRLTRAVAMKQGDLASLIQETLSINGALLSRGFGRQAYEVERFRKKARELNDLSIRRYRVARWLNALLGFLTGLGPAVLLVVGGLLFIRGQMSLGTILAFGLLINRLYAPVGTLANSHVQIMSAMVLFDRVFEYLDLTPEIQEPAAPIEVERIRGHIRFRDVSFRYRAEEWTLREVAFEAHPGQVVALVGRSGAGKSTLAFLIPRFYDITEGLVEIDGHDVRTLGFDTLQRAIGIVSQDTTLFHASIRENLRYARLSATDEEIEAACRAAQLHDVIERLPLKYDTLVGERGFHLSGGERQRMAIARVLLKDPAILILDEATSHLDSESEARVQEALEQLWEGRTALVIAHRFSTILRADLILVLEDGRIAERGKHEELLRRNGVYARLYREQFKHALEPSAENI